jgi:hypothetical protein
LQVVEAAVQVLLVQRLHLEAQAAQAYQAVLAVLL